MVILMISSLISFCLGGFIAVKCLQIGLRWKLQLDDKKTPVFEKNLVQKAIEKKEKAKEQEKSKSIFDEWVNGE